VVEAKESRKRAFADNPFSQKVAVDGIECNSKRGAFVEGRFMMCGLFVRLLV
jgi:hypothetical protein